MIRIGNQTSCWAISPGEPFDYALAQGFDAFEWFPDKKPGAGWDESDLDDRARLRIRDAAREKGIRLSVHARWQANLLLPDSFPLVLKDLELARDLGAALLNIHLFHEQGLPAFIEVIMPLIRQVAAAGLQLSIENTPHHAPELFNDLFARLSQMNFPDGQVGMCLDLGHANLCSATRNDFLAFCDRLAPHVPITHLHLHENWGDADSHLPLFTGPAARDDSGIRGLVARLKQREFSGSIILEQWPHPPSLLNNARDRLLQLWKASGGGKTLETNKTSVAPEDPASPPRAGGDLTSELVAGDRRARSWREKLDFVRSLLTREDSPVTADQLIDIAVYLRFLGAGQIVCGEDGRHFRPAHHSRIASQIQDRLARLTTAENTFIVREIYPLLPSSAPVFQRPEPLTRIRDIAHRNDIDQDLKREIKTTLQNKLHRCAGPEDLVTSSALLKRITAPTANYPSAFVEQFKLFHEELKEFFNARTLDDRLAALAPAVGTKRAELIAQFRRRHSDTSLADQLTTLRTLTLLRQDFLQTAEGKSPHESHEYMVADIALENFGFALLSEIINRCDGTEPGKAWNFMVEALLLALKNIALSGVESQEVKALEAELCAWSQMSVSPDRDELLRLNATLLRCHRLAEGFSAQQLSLFSERAAKLGRALGVAEHAIRVFSESTIRGHIIFQASKLATSLLGQIRVRLKLPPWDVLVSGRAVGRVQKLASLDELPRARQGPVIALLEKAAGDEEIPENVTGIALAHELPHLSHLAVRARQAGVVFATCEQTSEIEHLRGFEGQMISFLATPEKVTWQTAAGPAPDELGSRRPSPKIPKVRLLRKRAWIPLELADQETSGAKAAGLRRLAELSRLNGSAFSTPPAMVIPFGVMEAQLNLAPTIAAQYREVIQRIDKLPPGDFAAATQRLRGLVQQLEVPHSLAGEVERKFGPTSRLAVRSSANCEDVEACAGAGLYDSVLNVPPSDVPAALRTVWASLWTERAALSRKQAGIPHEDAHMAVLIQELLVSDFSFILHTINPVTHNSRELYAEVVVGLGDTLASATVRGSPYRLVCDKESGAVTTLAFANFSHASRPGPDGTLGSEIVDYSRVDLSTDANARNNLGRRLAAIGSFVERALQRPQDIEGVAAGDKISLVQARPQPGALSGEEL